MWQTVVLGNYRVRKIFTSDNGVWIVGYDYAFFVPNDNRQSASVVCEYSENWNVLGVVEDTLFLHNPDDNMVVAQHPDGSRVRVAIAVGGLVPVAVSCYVHEIFSPQKINVEGIGRDVYVYCLPYRRMLAVGKNFAVEWEKYQKQVEIYRKGEKSSVSIMTTDRFSFVDNVVVGDKIICLEGMKAFIFSPDQLSGICKSGTSCTAIGENTNRIAVYQKETKRVLCWEWGERKYGVIDAPRSGVDEIFVCGNRVFVCNYSRTGILSASFPELNIEGAFPYFSQELWTGAQEEQEEK